MTYRRPDTIVDMDAISTMLNVEKATIRQWRTRNVMPEPDYQLAMGPLWWRSTIEAWAKTTGRWEY